MSETKKETLALADDNDLIFDVVIIILIIGVFYLILFPIPNKDSLSYSQLDAIKRALVNPKLMTLSNHAEVFARYQTPSLRPKTFRENFLAQNSPKIREIASFGTAVLSKFAEAENRTEYLAVAEDLIRRLEDRLQNRDPAWKPHWREISVDLTRMLATYICLGRDAAVLDFCHQRIVGITPKLNRTLDRTLAGPDLARIAIPRLLANYVCDRSTFKKEVKSEVFGALARVFSVTQNVFESVRPGIYLDGSVVAGDVASFADVLDIAGFYARIFDAFGFKASISGFLTSTLDAVLYDKVDFLPLGLFGLTPQVSPVGILKDLPDYKRKTQNGVRIFPFVGFGVFKTPDFVFYLRTQRPKIGAYRSDHENFGLALGWIQLRKILHQDTNYGDLWDWSRIKTQPGVMYMKDTLEKVEAMRAGDEPITFQALRARSYLGHFDENGNKAMFWMNRYCFRPIFGDLEVSEFGVCTENGLTIKYFVKMENPKELWIQLADPDAKAKVRLFTDETLLDDGSVLLKSSGDVSWRQVYDQNAEPREIQYGDDFRSMEFKFQEYIWRVEAIDDCYFTVKKGKRIVMAGSSSGNTNDRFTFRGQTYKRDPQGLMYKLVE